MIIAKPVVPNQFWILKQDDRKIGNIESGPNGYSVKINNQVETYRTLNNIKRQISIDFEKIDRKKTAGYQTQAYGFETAGKPHNSMYDVKHQVPLWTRDARSKSWYAAGWYNIKQGRAWSTVFCPKLITLQRYAYQGPFHSEEQANVQSV